jgi:hypothetical protein
MGVDHARESQTLLAAWASLGALDLIHHAGDISYADNRLDGQVPAHEGEKHPEWYHGILGEYYDQMQPAATRIPYMLGAGNHEWPCNYSEYTVRQRAMPYRASGGDEEGFFYSYNWGRTHIVTLSGERLDAGIKPGSAQHRWLQSDLEHARAMRENGTLDWLIVTLHYPLYCSSTKAMCCAAPAPSADGSAVPGCNRTDPSWWRRPQDVDRCQSAELRESLEELLHENGVDFFLNGHEHQYERTHPTFNLTAAPGASANGSMTDVYHDPAHPIYITSGNPGCIEEWAPHTNWLTQPPFVARRITQWNYTTGTFYNPTGFTLLTLQNGTFARQRYIAAAWGPIREPAKTPPPPPPGLDSAGSSLGERAQECAAANAPVQVGRDGDAPAYHVLDGFDVVRGRLAVGSEVAARPSVVRGRRVREA